MKLGDAIRQRDSYGIYNIAGKRGEPLYSFISSMGMTTQTKLFFGEIQQTMEVMFPLPMTAELDHSLSLRTSQYAIQHFSGSGLAAVLEVSRSLSHFTYLRDGVIASPNCTVLAGEADTTPLTQQ